VNLGSRVPALLRTHPAIRAVELAGSRACGTAHALSDWDFVVATDDYPRLRTELPELVAPLDPLSHIWDPYSTIGCFMLILRGPTKVDLLFTDEPREWSGAWEVTADTLMDVDAHFWDWILWLEQKRRGGDRTLLRNGLDDLHRLLLAPLGAEREPSSVGEALELYLAARDRREHAFGVRVPRALEAEVRPVLG